MSWTRIGMIVVVALLVGCEKDNPIKCTGPNDPACSATPGTVCKRVSLPDMGAAAFRCLPDDAKCEQKPNVYLATTVCGSDAPICGNQCANMSCSCAKCSDFVGQEDQICSTAYSGVLSFCTNGACVQCKGSGATSVGCPATAPVCDGNSKCGPCAKHSECKSGVCKLADYYLGQTEIGTCASDSEVVVVDSSLMPGTTCKTSGFMPMPYCQIHQALNDSAAKFVLVRSGSYEPIKLPSLNGGTRVVVGPGRDAAKIALVSVDGNSTSLRLSSPGKILCDGLRFSGSINCNDPMAELGILRSVVNGYAADVFGVNAPDSSCKSLLVLASTIVNFKRSGIFIGAATDYQVTNSLVLGCGSGVSGVQVNSSSPTGIFAFNTIVRNPNGGVSCSAAASIKSSIIANNGAQQVSPMCKQESVSTDVPMFVGADVSTSIEPTDFRLKAATVKVPRDGKILGDYFGAARQMPTNIGFAEFP